MASEWETLVQDPTKEQLEQINQSYLLHVKPIFKEKCLDCHGVGREKPWYYILPGVRSLMDRDIEEAKEHMDMSKDFPFIGHGTAKDDLEAILTTIKDESMPPLQYRLIHWSSMLTFSEKKIVEQWVQQSIQSLKGETL